MSDAMSPSVLQLALHHPGRQTLLNQPLEIRRHIYAQILASDECTDSISVPYSAATKPALDLLQYRPGPITQICRQMKNEYIDYLFRTTWTILDCSLCERENSQPVVFANNATEEQAKSYRIWKAGIDFGLPINKIVLRLKRMEPVSAGWPSYWGAHVFISYYPEAKRYSVPYRTALAFNNAETVSETLQPGLARLRDVLGHMIDSNAPVHLKWGDIERLIDALSAPDAGTSEAYMPAEPGWEPDLNADLPAACAWDW